MVPEGSSKCIPPLRSAHSVGVCRFRESELFNWAEDKPKCDPFTEKWTVKEKEAKEGMHFICMEKSRTR